MAGHFDWRQQCRTEPRRTWSIELSLVVHGLKFADLLRNIGEPIGCGMRCRRKAQNATEISEHVIDLRQSFGEDTCAIVDKRGELN